MLVLLLRTELRKTQPVLRVAFSPTVFISPQAAYLVGVSDPNSQAGQQGLVEPTQFARANQAIQMACQSLGEPGCTQAQVMQECRYRGQG